MANISVPIQAVLQQPGTHHCWAAVVAMMQHRPGPDHRTIIHQVISEARAAGVSMNGDALDAVNGPRSLAGAFGFNCVDLRTQAVQDGNYFANFLRRQCPFGLFGNRPGYGLHAIAINRLHGDFASLNSTHAVGIDPIGGARSFSRTLFQLVMPTQQTSADMIGHYVLWR
jgi:hypothetical protein